MIFKITPRERRMILAARKRVHAVGTSTVKDLALLFLSNSKGSRSMNLISGESIIKNAFAILRSAPEMTLSGSEAVVEFFMKKHFDIPSTFDWSVVEERFSGKMPNETSYCVHYDENKDITIVVSLNNQKMGEGYLYYPYTVIIDNNHPSGLRKYIEHETGFRKLYDWNEIII